jgi:hydroxyacylglutathione hydrolase
VPSARAQYASIQHEFRPLPEFLQVWPAHGAGSACGKSLGDVPMSTVGYELRTNRSIKAASDEQTFVDFILAGQPEPPLYFARMKRDNKLGPAPMPALPSPERVDAAGVGVLAGRTDLVVIDTRHREAFLAGHLPGAILAELDFQYNSVAGSYVEAGTPIVLVVDDLHLDAAVRGLIRVGLDEVIAYVTPDVLAEYGRTGGTLVATESIDMARMEARRLAGEVRVLDVRGGAEFELEHVPGALNVAHTRVPLQIGALPTDKPFAVHCAAGARAAAVVSLLERHGVRAVHVNDVFANYRRQDAPSAAARA